MESIKKNGLPNSPASSTEIPFLIAETELLDKRSVDTSSDQKDSFRNILVSLDRKSGEQTDARLAIISSDNPTYKDTELTGNGSIPNGRTEQLATPTPTESTLASASFVESRLNESPLGVGQSEPGEIVDLANRSNLQHGKHLSVLKGVGEISNFSGASDLGDDALSGVTISALGGSDSALDFDSVRSTSHIITVGLDPDGLIGTVPTSLQTPGNSSDTGHSNLPDPITIVSKDAPENTSGVAFFIDHHLKTERLKANSSELEGIVTGVNPVSTPLQNNRTQSIVSTTMPAQGSVTSVPAGSIPEDISPRIPSSSILERSLMISRSAPETFNFDEFQVSLTASKPMQPSLGGEVEGVAPRVVNSLAEAEIQPLKSTSVLGHVDSNRQPEISKSVDTNQLVLASHLLNVKKSAISPTSIENVMSDEIVEEFITPVTDQSRKIGITVPLGSESSTNVNARNGAASIHLDTLATKNHEILKYGAPNTVQADERVSLQLEGKIKATTDVDMEANVDVSTGDKPPGKEKVDASEVKFSPFKIEEVRPRTVPSIANELPINSGLVEPKQSLLTLNHGIASDSSGPAVFQSSLKAVVDTSGGAAQTQSSLVSQLKIFSENGVRNATLHMKPAELGSISVQISIEGETLNMQLVAAQANTREIMELSMPRLREQLSSNYEQVNVSLSQSEGKSSEDGRAGMRGNSRGAAGEMILDSDEIDQTASGNIDSGSHSTTSIIDKYV